MLFQGIDMKILIVSASDIGGGAARAAYRLHQALLSEGVDSQMLVQNKIGDDHTVLSAESKREKVFSKIRPHLDALAVRLYKNRTKGFFSPARLSTSIVDRINILNPDVVHLHWVNDGMLKIEDLPKIKAPIVWSMHDMWVFTGGCHYTDGCEKFENSCGSCLVLGSSKENDLSKRVFNRKAKIFPKLKNTTFVGMSHWMSEMAKCSSLLKNANVITLPNLLDTTVFSPANSKIARELLHLPQDKKLVLFGAIRATDDPRKGFEELQMAINKMEMSNMELVIFGSSEPKEGNKLKYPTHYMGHLHDDVTLRLLYSAVDVMVIPSRQEAFGQMATEAMACGTPVVAFGHTGLLDIVDHKLNGYLAKLLDTSDLAQGLEWVLNAIDSDELGKNAREKVLNVFDSKLVGKQYIELYEYILNR